MEQEKMTEKQHQDIKEVIDSLEDNQQLNVVSLLSIKVTWRVVVGLGWEAT